MGPWFVNKAASKALHQPPLGPLKFPTDKDSPRLYQSPGTALMAGTLPAVKAL